MAKKTQKIVIDRNGNEYTIEGSLGSGGQAVVKRVRNVKTKKEFALKIYTAQKATYQLKKNIEAIIANGGIKDASGNKLEYVITPISIVDGKNGAFGYIMEFVNLDDYISIISSWKYQRPSLTTICKIVKQLCIFYRALHRTKGWCYKDLNEGNVYFNPKTGDVMIIDTDNIGEFEKELVKGTARYMAPEVVLGEYKPDTRSDYFSLAVFVYRLLVGGFPFEGRYVSNYCLKNDIGLDDAMKKLLGKDALYVWHSTNKSNSIENCNSKIWDAQARYYHSLSPKIQEAFKNTFEINLEFSRRAERFSDDEWYDLFDKLEKEIKKCPHKKGFNNGQTFPDAELCYDCGKVQTSFKPLSTPPKNSSNNMSFTVQVISAGDSKKNLTFKEHQVVKGSEISRHLPQGNLFKTGYSKSKGLFTIMNVSNYIWTIHYDNKTQKQCPPGKQVFIKSDRIISFMAKKVNIKFVSQN